MSNLCFVCQKSASQKCSACSLTYYCNRQHQKDDWPRHKKSCRSYRIIVDSVKGRCLVATRYIPPGEVILKQRPLILSPKTVSTSLCLICHKKLGHWFSCDQCSWPLCCQSPQHASECQFLSKLPPPLVKNGGKQSNYALIGPLRALLLKKSDPEGFGKLMECQAHLDEHLTTPLFQILKKSLVPLLSQLGFDTNEREILTICSIFDTNCFEVRARDVNVRGLYPEVSLLSHDCKHNTKHTFDGEFVLTLTSTCPIKKGEFITVTYTQTLWSTLERKKHLKVSKCFDCVCQRCLDPTEFGTFVGSFLCTNCQIGKVYQSRCQNCGFEMTNTEVLHECLKKEISAMDKTPENLEDFLQKHEQVLHPKNTFSLQVKYALVQIYGNVKGYTLKELNDPVLERKVHLCEELLEVADVLEPGLSRFRGVLLLDLYEALVEKCKRQNKSVDVKVTKYLVEANDILRMEPDLCEVVAQKMECLKI